MPKVPQITREEANAERLSQVPGIQKCGTLHKSSLPVQLTESETEYTVSCIKHCYTSHMVFQFDCVNTLNDQLLENVRVDLVVPDEYVVRAVIPCPRLPYSEVGATYVIVEFPEEKTMTVGTFCATLKFSVKDCDPNTGEPDSDEGYDDEYMLEDLDVTVADQVQKAKKSNFNAAWDSADTEEWVEAEDVYELSAVSTLQDAVDSILKFLGLSPASMTEKVADGVSTHTLLCSGELTGSRLMSVACANWCRTAWGPLMGDDGRAVRFINSVVIRGVRNSSACSHYRSLIGGSGGGKSKGRRSECAGG